MLHAMSLSGNEKGELAQTAATLIELDEPEALLATLKRACERKALDRSQGLIDDAAAARWEGLAKSLAEAETRLGAASPASKPV
jgi:hypothetical protein